MIVYVLLHWLHLFFIQHALINSLENLLKIINAPHTAIDTGVYARAHNSADHELKHRKNLSCTATLYADHN